MFFLPLFDNNPAVARPFVTWIIIALCLSGFIWQESLDYRTAHNIVYQLGFIPAVFFTPANLPENMTLVPEWSTIFTSMFLHAGWMHIGGNLLYLWIFGDNIEDILGRTKFIIFYLVGGFAASYFQALFEPESIIPLVGASGSIAAVLGAYLLMYPRANIKVLFWFFIILQVINVPAFMVLGVWIVGQFFSLSSMVESNVAYVAHIGGFFSGILLFLFLKNKNASIFSESVSQPFQTSTVKAAYSSRIYDRKRSSGIKRYD